MKIGQKYEGKWVQVSWMTDSFMMIVMLLTHLWTVSYKLEKNNAVMYVTKLWLIFFLKKENKNITFVFLADE